MRSGASSTRRRSPAIRLDPLDRLRGDDWDHTAVDPESRLLLCLVPGKREGTACKRVLREVHDRTAGRTDLLFTSDEHAPYETAIKEVYGIERPRPRRPGPGRPPKPVKVLPEDLCYATVRKRREKGRVVEVVRTLVFGTLALLQAFLGRSTVSTTINTSFVERHNGTDRHQNSPQASQDLRLLQGDGAAPRGVVLHRVQLQLLLVCADVTSRR